MYRNLEKDSSAFPVAKRDSETPNHGVPPRAEIQPAAPPAGSGATAGRNRPLRLNRRRLAIGGLAVVALIAATWFGLNWLIVGRFMVSTDDAYVQAYNTTLAAKVSGYLSNVAVTDNTRVHAGDVIATIDDGDYRLAVDSARAKVTTQEATIARIGHQITAQQAAVEQAKTQLVSARAAATRTELELERQNLLVARDASSRQLLEQAQANRDQAVAAVHGAQAAIDSAAANVDVLKGQRQEAAGTLDELKASLAKAERDLSFTVIRAPIDGVIGNRAMQTGDFVQTGQRLASVVPLDDVYVTANFKETQLARLRPGQPVAIAVDALPEHSIQGVVESFSPASGAVFSLLPPDNATGNFTKIVQRLPVRIRVPATIAREGQLRPGLSVVVSVNTKPGAAVADIETPAQRTAVR
ncbi:MAG TPA: HlyD family secretion protein [Xanthobacteraceae bacterium]|nr:HlyD family secretion protein [Xanthobacteraceae bacterium]